MKGILSIFWFTFREQARKKSFIISTVILYVIIIAALCVPAIISAVKGSSKQDSSSKATDTVYVIDSDSIISNNLQELSSNLSGYNFVLKQPADKQELMDSIKDGSSESLIVLSLKNNAPSFDLYVKNITDGISASDLSIAIKKIYGENLLSQNGVSQELISNAYADVAYTSTTLGRGTVGGMVASMLVVLVLFMSIYMYGYWVAMSIASEKTSRIMEVLITSTKPSHIVIGKSLGMGILGLCQLLGMIIISAVTYMLAYPKSFEISGVAINLSCFSPFAVLMLIVYFIFGFALYAMMYAVCGATVSKAEDIQQAVMPVTLIAIISFYFTYTTAMTSSDSAAAVAASLVPFSSPFSMPSRILSAAVPAWQIILSLVLLAGTTVLMTFISIKLYSSAVLHYGKRLKIKELVQMSKSK